MSAPEGLGVRRWLGSRTYSLVLIGFAGSFVLDWYKAAGTWGIVVPAGFALIGGRMYRQTRMARPPAPSSPPAPLAAPPAHPVPGSRADTTQELG